MDLSLVDVSARDGLQNEPGAGALSVDDKIAYILMLARAGLTRIEAGSFVKPSAVPSMAGSDEIAQRLKGEQENFPNVVFSYLVPNLKGLERAKAAEAKEIAIFLALSEKFSKANINQSVDESFQNIAPVIAAANAAHIRVRGYLSNIFGYDDLPFSPQEAAKRSKQLLELGCYEVSLGDTTGIGKPEQVETLIKALHVPLSKVAMHFHDTFGKAIDNVDTSYGLGIRTFDASTGGIGGCPYANSPKGNVAMESVVRWAQSKNLSCDVKDVAELEKAGAFMKKAGQGMSNIYNQQLDKNAANYLPLTPLGFLERSADVYPDHLALVHGDISYTWAQVYARCRKLASALQKRGIGVGDTVSIMAPNVPAHFEVYFGVPMCGAVINGLNTRLDAPTIAFMLRHSETKLLIVDKQFSHIIGPALKLMDDKDRPAVIDIDDPAFQGGELLGEKNYEQLLKEGDPHFEWLWPKDEWDAISLNYTSGTTGDPKGVVYHHRGAYLNALGNVLAFNSMPAHPVYLWTLPMFHASGWCFPWTTTVLAGTNICLRKVEAAAVFELIEKHNVTHFTAAPVVLNMLINAPDNVKRKFGRTIQIMTAGSAPPAAVLEAMERMEFNVTHVYGGTEVFGPNMSCAWHPEWDALPKNEQANLKARQGVRYHSLEFMQVAEPESMKELPRDGTSIGEVLMRGNVVMKGYLKNPKTNEATFRGGWYHTGDLATRHENGYIEIKDRLKDIIISGAENISTIEIESVLYRHPAVLEAAVVAKPHEHWGEVPCAFIELKNGASATEAEIIEHCRAGMAHFKAPKHVVFGPLDKTPTGKIQKYLLRERAKTI